MAITLTEKAANHISRFLERRGKGVGLRFGVQIVPVQLAQIGSSFDRIAQNVISVICHSRPLDGGPFFRFGCRDETIRVNQILYFLVRCIQRLPVNGKLYRQVEKLEMILHKRLCECQTLKLFPHPHASVTFGL